MSHRAFLPVVAFVWALTLASGAADGASIMGVVPYAPAQGPVLAGARLVYVPSGQSGSGPVRIEAAAGAHGSVLAWLPGEPARTDGGSFTGRGVLAAIAASPTTLVATVTTVFDLGGGRSGDPGQHLSRTWAGALGGPLAAVSGACSFPRDLRFPAADGDQVATEGMGCGPLEVLDLANQGRRALPPAAVSPVVIAGSLTAWLQADASDGAGPSAAVVADATGSELLRVPVAAVNGDVRLTLDTDGTLALFGHVDPKSPNAVAVAVASPAQPVPRVLETPMGSTLVGARLAQGRVAMLLVPRRTNSVTGGEVVITDTAGAHARTVLRGVGAYGQDGFSFDGQNVAAIVNHCDNALLVRASAGDSAAKLPTARPCALKLLGRPHWSQTSLTIALSCRGLSDCQAAHVTARLGGPRGTLLGRATSDRSATVSLPVKRALRHRLATRTTKVWIQAQLIDGAGTSPSRVTSVTVPPRRS